MFLTLLAVTFVISALVCFVVDLVFRRPIQSIMERIIQDDISAAWVRYVRFALYVVGISGGVNLHQIDDYINPGYEGREPIALTRDRWVLEVYRTIIEALQSIAWMLLVFFIVALIAFVVVRLFEGRRNRGAEATLSSGRAEES